MLQLGGSITSNMSASLSRHFVAEKVKALCFVSDVRYASETLQEEYDVLPLVATGGWDNETNHVTLHLPARPTRDERELRREFGRGESDALPCELNTLAEAEHDGDVNALRFVRARGENLLNEDVTMTGGESNKPLSAFAIPQWEKLFAGTAATCVEVSENRTSLATASASGALAWLRLDDAVSVEKIENKDTSRLPINAVKFLGRDTVVATVGSTPGGQLRIWDLIANNQFPVTTCTDPTSRSILTTLETHPTRPELLITGANDGHVSFWDRRKLDTPFRTEVHHQRAVRALKLHSASPQYLYTGGDDAVVNCWDFHYGRSPRDPVEYERYGGSTANQSLTPFGSQVVVPSNGFSKVLGGLQVQALASGSQPWNALAVHADSDTLVAGSDAQSMVIVQHASKWKK